MHFYLVIFINIILNISIIVFGTLFFLKIIYEIISQKYQVISTKGGGEYDSNEVFLDQLKIFRKKFWKIFYMLEFSLIAYFLFWSLIFSGAINVVF